MDLTSSSSSPATPGKIWKGQRDGLENVRESLILLNQSLCHYQSLFIFHSFGPRDGGLADSLADGLGLKLRTSRLSVAIFVPLSFQPVGFNLNVPLESREIKECGGKFHFFVLRADFPPQFAPVTRDLNAKKHKKLHVFKPRKNKKPN